MSPVSDRNPRTDSRDTDEDGMWRHLEDAPQEHDDAEGPTPQLTPSQAKRLGAPMVGMVITMGVLSLGLAALWFMNPEPDVTYTRDEDVFEAAAWTDQVAEYSPIAPEMPEEWSANYARWETRAEHGVEVWEVGYTTEAVNFVGFAQTDNANPAWVNEETEQAPVTGAVTIDELAFETREQGDRQYYVLAAEDNTVDGTTVVIGGDAGDDEFQTAVDAIVGSLGQEIDFEHAEENADD